MNEVLLILLIQNKVPFEYKNGIMFLGKVPAELESIVQSLLR